jgi:uncharacterized protein (UPF0261 family)
MHIQRVINSKSEYRNPKQIQIPIVAIVGTFDSKEEEHLFLKNRIEGLGLQVLTVNVGTKEPIPFEVSYDLYALMKKNGNLDDGNRDKAIQGMIREGIKLIKQLFRSGKIHGMISAGGGSGTHLCSSIMRALPLGIPKVMVSTVASRDMKQTVGTKDITMIHSVVDLLGVNSISGIILDKAAAAICGMTRSQWQPDTEKRRIALSFFGFITKSAEAVKRELERMDYEVIPFHANGTGGMAMEELASEGYFHGILDLATHELADALMGGYCSGIGPDRFEPTPGKNIPRLVTPGGLDCAVLEFTRRHIPEEHRNRKVFFYDFRSAIRLTLEESRVLAEQLSDKLNKDVSNVHVLIPTRGWSEADKENEPLYDPETNAYFVKLFKEKLDNRIHLEEVDMHINDPAFARKAADIMDQMVRDRM